MTRSSKVAAAAIAAVLALLLYPRPAPSSGPVIPSAPKGAASTDQAQSGAPTAAVSASAGPVEASVLGSNAVPSGAPLPTGGIGQPASYCRQFCDSPEPRVVVSKGSGGWASFYDDGPGIYVALPGWTRDSPIRTVVVCANVGLWRCATANVWTSCGCHTDSDHPKIVDLSPDLMALITGWDRATMTNRGVVRVTLQVIGGTP